MAGERAAGEAASHPRRGPGAGHGAASQAAPVDPALLRRTMGCFATGVAVITAWLDDEPHGMTVNSLTSVSLDPPLLLVCFTHGARTADAVRESGRFGVNILGARQENVSNMFARRGTDHFAGLNVRPDPDRSPPAIPGALARVGCRVERLLDVGDHVVVFGAVEQAQHREGAPLLFF
ncbi:MAG: flavin reductase family protein, partial [Micromonosporaceae bacterium]